MVVSSLIISLCRQSTYFCWLIRISYISLSCILFSFTLRVSFSLSDSRSDSTTLFLRDSLSRLAEEITSS